MKPLPPPKEKYIDTPEELEALFHEFVSQLKPVKMTVMHPKLGTVELEVDPPITIKGFFVWGHKVKKLTLRHYIYPPQDNKYQAFTDVAEYIKDSCFDHNFNGAACGKYKEQLIKAFHGIAEKTENKNENITRVININPIPSGTAIATSEKDILLD